MEPEQIEMTSEQARSGWRQLLNGIERYGEHVTVTRYGEPVAVIVPVTWWVQARADLAAAEAR